MTCLRNESIENGKRDEEVKERRGEASGELVNCLLSSLPGNVRRKCRQRVMLDRDRNVTERFLILISRGWEGLKCFSHCHFPISILATFCLKDYIQDHTPLPPLFLFPFSFSEHVGRRLSDAVFWVNSI